MDYIDRLDQEISNDLEILEKTSLGSEEYDRAANSVGKLMDRRLEFERLKLENEDKVQQRKHDKKDGILRNIINLLGILAPIGAGIWTVVQSFNFEENGTIRNTPGKKASSDLMSFKRK